MFFELGKDDWHSIILVVNYYFKKKYIKLIILDVFK